MVDRRLGPRRRGADSRQVYRHMQIGTAQPDQLAAGVPHHLIGFLDPDESFSLVRYQELAYRTISEIQARGRLPFLVGGTGQYVWAVIEGWEVPRVTPRPGLRQELEARADAIGAEKLYSELLASDPEAAKKINPNNVRRVIRALEVYQATGVPFSQLRRKKAPPFRSLIIGLTAARAALYKRVDARVEDMVKHGLINETGKLAELGYDLNLPALSGIGYRQIVSYLRGEMTLEAAVQQIKYETHRYIRQQYAWFKPGDKRIHWFDIQQDIEPEITHLISEFLRG